MKKNKAFKKHPESLAIINVVPHGITSTRLHFAQYELLAQIMNKKKPHRCKAFCGPTWARTMDPLIMSQVL